MTANDARKWFIDLASYFSPLYDDLKAEESLDSFRPLLAHYTSVEVFEAVLRNNEIWFSNPLFMDDVEEIRFGIREGVEQFLQSEIVKEACGSTARSNQLLDAFDYYYMQFVNEHVLDVFVLCLSEHDPEDKDGRLSMWRGYGGNGKGIALVIDTAKLNLIPDSPLVIGKVSYGSSADRKRWLADKIESFAALLRTHPGVPDSKLYLAAHIMFERIKLFALFSKHIGFSEEQEWRVVYVKERDINRRLEPMLHYAIGRRGLEPKLKLKLVPTDGVMATDFGLNRITHQIILGPSTSSPLAHAAVCRVLDRIGKSHLKACVVSSNIPFRPGHLG